MKTYFFKAVFGKDSYPDGTMGYYAYCPALKGCHTCGHTLEEAKKNIEEAVLCHIESLLKDGEPIPAGIIEVPTHHNPF